MIPPFVSDSVGNLEEATSNGKDDHTPLYRDDPPSEYSTRILYFAPSSNFSCLLVVDVLGPSFDNDNESEEHAIFAAAVITPAKETISAEVVVKSPEVQSKNRFQQKPMSVAEALQVSTAQQTSVMEKKVQLEARKIELAEKRAEIDREERRTERWEDRQEREREREHEIAKLKLRLELAKAGVTESGG